MPTEEISNEQLVPIRDAMLLARDSAWETIQKVKTFDNSRGDAYCIALFASMIEYANTGLLLASKHTSAGDDSVFRSFLEAFVDLKNLVSDNEYQFVLQLEYHHQWIKLLRAADGQNEYLASIATDADKNSQLKDHEKQIQWLKKKKVPQLNKMQKFKKANMLAEYQSLYNFTSSEAHNNLRALIRRNLSFSNDQIVVRVNFWSNSRCRTRFDTYSAMLLLASEMTAKHFVLDIEGLLEKPKEALIQARKAYEENG